MDNAYGKGHYSRPEPANTVVIKIPKNIRQVGNVNSHKIIYVEDYVMTFVKQLSERDPGSCKVAILLGYYVKTKEKKNIFIKGAIEMKNVDLSSGINLTDEGWTSIYENIKKYFTDVEIVGWALTGPEFYLDSMDKIKNVHITNFSGPDKVLLKLDSMEKEENFYISENNNLTIQHGYYIYYEKNEEMQNYMIENKEEDIREETLYDDQATKKIRSIIKDKKEAKDDRNVIRLLYAASSLLAIIVLVIAATMLDNYEKMKNMETALSTISESLNMANKDKEKLDFNADKKTAQNNSDQNNETDSQDKNNTLPKEESDSLDIETVPGNIKKNDDNIVEDDNKDSNEDGESNEENSDSSQNTDKAEDESDREINTPSDSNNRSGNKDTEEENTDDDNTVETSAPIKYYTVKAGDSLASISYKLYQTYSYMDKIKELNNIVDENLIYEGQKLIVP